MLSRLSHGFLGWASLAVLLLMPSMALATPDLDPCTGGDCVFVGIFGGNDLSPGPDKSLVIDGIVAPMDVDLIPVGSENEFDAGDLGSTIGLFTATDDGDGLSGTWSISSGSVDYVSVKAGPDFALYQYIPAASSGNWSTDGLVVGQNNNQPGLSHLTFWKKVPEPGTLSLMLVGMAGWIAIGPGVRRRRP